MEDDKRDDNSRGLVSFVNGGWERKWHVKATVGAGSNQLAIGTLCGEFAMVPTLAFLFGNKGRGCTCGWVRFRGEGLKGAEAVQPDSEFDQLGHLREFLRVSATGSGSGDEPRQ